MLSLKKQTNKQTKRATVILQVLIFPLSVSFTEKNNSRMTAFDLLIINYLMSFLV